MERSLNGFTARRLGRSARTAGRMAFLGCAAALSLFPAMANAHPHVFVEANLEIVRNDDGAVTALRHVWRFDELFSSTVLLDFDADASGDLNQDELDEVSKAVTQSIKEQGWFTEVRRGEKSLDFEGPDKILVDYTDGQVLMFFEATFGEPVKTGQEKFRVSVADPTYYVAMDVANEAAVQIRGHAEQCAVSIYRPDYDALFAQSSATLTEQFFQDPGNAMSDDKWFTWIDMTCSQ